MKSRGLVNHHLHVCGQAGLTAGVGRGVARVPRLRPLLRLLLRPLLRPLAAGAVPAGAGRVGGRGGRARVRQVPGVVPRAGLLVPIQIHYSHTAHSVWPLQVRAADILLGRQYYSGFPIPMICMRISTKYLTNI